MVEFSRLPTLGHLESLRKTEMLFAKCATSPQTFSAGFCLFVSFHFLSFPLICQCTLFLSGCELVYYCTTTCQVNERSCSPFFNLSISQGSETFCHLFELCCSTKTKNNITFYHILFNMLSYKIISSKQTKTD